MTERTPEQYEQYRQEEVVPSKEYREGFDIGLFLHHIVVPGNSDLVFWDIAQIPTAFGYPSHGVGHEYERHQRACFIIGYCDGIRQAMQKYNLSHSYKEWQNSNKELFEAIQALGPDVDHWQALYDSLMASFQINCTETMARICNAIGNNHQPLKSTSANLAEAMADLCDILKTFDVYDRAGLALLEHWLYVTATYAKVAHKAMLDKEYSANKGEQNYEAN